MKTIIHKSLRWEPVAVIAAVMAALLTTVASAQVLYQEDFERSNVGGNNAVNTLGWNAYYTASATDISAANTLVAITPVAGNPNTTFGALFAAPTGSQNFAMVETFASPLAVPIDGSGQISWTMGNTNLSSTVRLLIQLNGTGSVNSGSWIASIATFSNGGYASFSSFSSAATQDVTFGMAFTQAKESWQNFTLNPGVAMSRGVNPLSNDLTSTQITGIGFYALSTSGDNVRLDTLTVVPEPSTAILAGVTGLVLLALRRRR